jgi:hypothetical protein
MTLRVAKMRVVFRDFAVHLADLRLHEFRGQSVRNHVTHAAVPKCVHRGLRVENCQRLRNVSHFKAAQEIRPLGSGQVFGRQADDSGVHRVQR